MPDVIICADCGVEK